MRTRADHCEVDGWFEAGVVCPVKISAVRATYEHLAGSWRRATPERRLGLIGELELLDCNCRRSAPTTRTATTSSRLRADILPLVTEIYIGLADPD